MKTIKSRNVFSDFIKTINEVAKVQNEFVNKSDNKLENVK